MSQTYTRHRTIGDDRETALRARRGGRKPVSGAAPGAVMAFGIFGLASLPHLLPHRSIVMALFAAALCALWLLLAVIYARALWQGHGGRYSRGVVSRFAVGTWVAGSSVTGALLLNVWPQAWLAGSALLAVAVAAWIWLLWLAAGALPGLLGRSHPGAGSTPIILLGTVGTQAIVLLANVLFAVPRPVLAAAIAFGIALYLLSIAIILWRYVQRRDARFIAHSSNTHCIIHGALSISGLAMVRTAALPVDIMLMLAAVVLAIFCVMEIVDVLRLIHRVRRYGWRRGVFTYRVSQWARNFTFGMLFAFMHALHTDVAIHSRLIDMDLAEPVRLIDVYGAYVVLALLVIVSASWLWRQVETMRSRWATW